MLTAFIAAAVAIIAVIADQISKYLVVRGMDLHEERSIVDGFFSLYRTENRGAAFSMLSEKQWIFMTLSFVAMAVMVVFVIIYNKPHIFITVSHSMVLGGGIGNMIDRVANGYVVDFIDFQFMKFAVFNVADIFV
ncbi:MAG: signal peptidase II, partial [Clostridiales bacterium]|nr:signal peptidase II [Candidatus Coliplasma equi]